MFQTLNRLIKNRKKVLGLNDRYLTFIRPYNLKSAIEIADDKIITKEILAANEIPVPEVIAVIRNIEELEHIDFESFPKTFVIKPVQGVRGGGVEIFYNRDKEGRWIQGSGRKIDVDQIKAMCVDIIDGRYSLHNEPDVVLIEERIKPHKAFRYHTYKGTPDIRVIVFNKVPVMGMLRLPTVVSKGKGNLDQGAIGAGIDMAVGKTTNSIFGKSGDIERVPHSNLPISGVRIPYWERILRYSIESSVATKLGFAAIDFLIDKEKGPVVVEMNARPGLSIQLANKAGLKDRLDKVAGLNVKSVKQGIRLSKDLFGGEIEEGIEALSGKQLIGFIEKVKIFKLNADSTYQEKPSEEFLSKVDTGAYRTSIDENIMREMGYSEVIEYFKSFDYPIFKTIAEAKKVGEERDLKIQNKEIQEHPLMKSRTIVKSGTGVSIRPVVPIKLEISGVTFETDATVVNRSQLNYKAIIGRKDLKRFLIDPSRKS